MGAELLWWHWLVAGIALVLAELAIPAFFVIWFGAGALLVGAAAFFIRDLSLAEQIALWILASLAFAFAWFRVFRTGAHKTRIGMAGGEAVGEAGLAVTPVVPFEKGRVRFQKPLLGADEWVCIADEPIAAGERVFVISVEGSFLKVARRPRSGA